LFRFGMVMEEDMLGMRAGCEESIGEASGWVVMLVRRC